MKTKRCSKCGKVKSVNEFHKDRINKDGLRSECKKCLISGTLNVVVTDILREKFGG